MKGIANVLLPFSWLFQLGVRLRNLLFDRGIWPQWKAPVPVISVGNLSTGGTGKTPVSIALLRYLQEKHPNHIPAYLSRGYGRKTNGYVLLEAGGQAQMYGDEAWQTFHNFPDLPIAVCENRKSGIQHLLLERELDVCLLDDAYQHRWVDRDLNIVVISMRRPPWKDAMLPAGRLREPMSHLSRADLMVLNHATEAAELSDALVRLAPFNTPVAACYPRFSELRWVQGNEAPTSLESLQNRNVCLLAGIGDPEAFADMVAATGARIVEKRFLRDHQAFAVEDLLAPQEEGTWVLTSGRGRLWNELTEKESRPLFHAFFFAGPKRSIQRRLSKPMRRFSRNTRVLMEGCSSGPATSSLTLSLFALLYRYVHVVKPSRSCWRFQMFRQHGTFAESCVPCHVKPSAERSPEAPKGTSLV
ncbi:MAG: tetraacyldisaccharide 4'-kinase [Bacteroidota bacterium]